ncbi:MAG: PD-(D/E)XK nuclease family protein [Methylacidiphilales bacterium]|nr:PD-(D/E)XK nuclease family protein [Candidatus Methylacidiphilales bacterium]
MTHLFSTASVEEQWRTVVAPWLREQAVTAWRNSRPAVVLTPGRAESFYLRSRLLGEGSGFLGIHFWTPSDTRKFLLAELAEKTGTLPATQAELRLLARSSAEKLLRKKSDADATLASVVQEPEPFLRAYDLLTGAGWDPVREGAAYGRALAKEFLSALRKQKIDTQAGIHRRLRQEVDSRNKPLIGNLLVTGFSAMHWPLWDLLKAAVLSAETAVVTLQAPRVFGQEVDQLWQGSWEELLGTAVEIPEGENETEDGPWADLSSSYEKGTPGNGANGVDLTFLAAPGTILLTRAVVLQALDYLKRDSCSRLGIIFPEANGLALGVAWELGRLGIPLDDGVGADAPGIFERRPWQSWVALQEEVSVARLTEWLRACETHDVATGLKELSVRKAADVLDGALGETLVDDLDFLAGYLEGRKEDRAATLLADFLRHRVALPEEARFADFLARTREAMTLRGWDEFRSRLQIDPPEWLMAGREKILRRTFLKWLKEVTDSREWTSEGNHFYGKVHLLIHAQMAGQTWSHLILTGMNEGVWPRFFDAGAFGSRHELAELNRKGRELNRRGTAQGGQGEGHETVAPEHGHCLLPLERQELFLRDLCAALEGTSEAVCLAALSTDSGRSLLPSDFLNQAYQYKTGRQLDDAAFRHLAASTAEWCEQHDKLFQEEDKAAPADVADTRIAFNARRDFTKPFGRYEFAYGQAPPRPIQLSCKEWEEAWNHPAQVWLEKIVGVAPWPDGTLSWPRAIGTWVHRWLAQALRESDKGDFLSRLQSATEQERHWAQERARTSGIELYPWWEQVWSQAWSIAVGLGEALAPHLTGKEILAEFRLPPELMIALPGTNLADFLLRGRIDLLLSEPGDKFPGRDCWVIDFKTGSAQSLSVKRLEKGAGLQAVLYALAMRALGAESVSISLHTFDAALKRQADLDEMTGAESFFRSLDQFHRKGIFGMRADAENEYGYSPLYPMATRPVPADILQAKWARAHEANPTDGEGS